jgi:hypothetical protein
MPVGSQLDLTNNDLIVDYSGASPIGSFNGTTYTGLTGLVVSGRQSLAWNGSGIVSSAARPITRSPRSASEKPPTC